jgi:uncharacterized protein
MDRVEELFEAVARSDGPRVGAIVREQPELARCRNADTLPVLVFARYVGDRAIFDALVAAGPPLDVFEAAQVDAADRLADLLDDDSSLASAYSDDGFTALHFVAVYGAPSAVALLLDRGANTEAVTKNFLTNMALHAAAAGGYTTSASCCSNAARTSTRSSTAASRRCTRQDSETTARWRSSS